MKKVFVYFSMLLAIGLLSACSNSDESEGKDLGHPIKSITDVSGFVSYNKNIRKWCLLDYIDGTIDCVNTYYPTEFANTFKAEGLKVVFSGEVFIADNNIPRLAGEEVYIIKLTKIEKAQ